MSRIIYLLLFCFAPQFDAKVTHKVVPRIVSNAQHKTENCSTDPLSPCLNEVVVIENPFLTPVDVTIGCGEMNDTQELHIPARTRLSIDIELTAPPARDPACQLIGYKVAK